MKKFGNKKGIVLILSFIMMAVTAVIVFVFLYVVTAQVRSVTSYADRAKAYWLAEAGTQRAVNELRKPGNIYLNNPSALKLPNQSLAGSQGVYSVDDVRYATDASGGTIINRYIITSKGAIGNEERTIRSIWTIESQSRFHWASFAGGGSGYGVNLIGLVRTDSYDSTKGAYNALLPDGTRNIGHNGDIGTNADIRTFGWVNIDGDAATGPAGTYNKPGEVTGTIAHNANETLPPVTVPAALTSLPSSGDLTMIGDQNQTLPAGDYKYSGINLLGNNTLTITGPANIYTTGTVLIGGRSAINVTGTGPVKIYNDKSFNVIGLGVINTSQNPANFQIYGTSANSWIAYLGAVAFYGTIYAPNVDVVLGGAMGMYGAFISDTMSIIGLGGVHYDESLLNSANNLDPQMVTAIAATQEDYHEF